MTLRFGILGTGNIARQFAGGLRRSHSANLAAVGSRAIETAAKFADEHSVAKYYGSYQSLIDDAALDAIYISLPNSMHHEWSIKALRAGKHVLCEKPLATTSAQGEEMFAAAAAAGRVLVEAFMYRAHPQTLAVLKAIRDGAIGKVRVIRTSFCYRTKTIEGNIRFDSALAGGALMDIGCYCLDFSRLVAGSEPVDVVAQGVFGPQGVDVMTSGSLRFADDTIASFVCGMTAQADNAAMICGDEGWIRVPVPWKPMAKSSFTIERQTPPRQDGAPAGRPPLEKIELSDERDVFAIEADAFADIVLRHQRPFMPEADSVGTMRLLDTVRLKIKQTP